MLSIKRYFLKSGSSSSCFFLIYSGERPINADSSTASGKAFGSTLSGAAADLTPGIDIDGGHSPEEILNVLTLDFGGDGI